MVLNGVLFRLVENAEGFNQWIYLVSREAFESAFRGTRWEKCKKPQFLLRKKLVEDGPGRVRVAITVRYIESYCNGDGIRMRRRRFQLGFLAETQSG